jgi:hypothetical protein
MLRLFGDKRAKKPFDKVNKEICIISRLRDVRITMAGVVERVDGEIFRQFRHDLPEKI